MILKHLFEPSIAQSAYLVGCAETGEAVVVDPTIDIHPYLEAAAHEGLRITGAAETHIHADFVSGGRALARAVGGMLYVSGEGGPDWQYSFAHEPDVQVLHHGDAVTIGRVRLDVLHTPGHTPEHLTYLITDTRTSPEPRGALTGDFVFVGDVGRPDLLETAAGQHGTMAGSARQLYASLRTLAPFPDHLVLWPGHGSGSACGKSLSGVPVSSLGYERLTNWALRETEERAFVAAVLADQPDPPMYFAEMKRMNRHGADAWVPAPMPPVGAAALEALLSSGELVVDVRGEDSGGRLPGAIAIPMGGSFSAWAGSVVTASRFFIHASTVAQAEAARRVLALIGRTEAAGWIGPDAVRPYQAAGGRMLVLDHISEPRADQTIVDVRSTAEWRAGHLDGAVHAPLARLPERIHDLGLDPAAPVLVYCQSGARSAVAATAMQRLGFARVATLEGGVTALGQARGPSA